jgi:hypothetical protein
LHRDLLVVEVDVDDGAHPAQADHDAVSNRERTARKSCAGAACDEWHIALRTGADDPCHLLSRRREHDRRRRDATTGETVARVGLQCSRLGDDALVADGGAQTMQQRTVKHAKPSPPPRHQWCGQRRPL